MSWWNVFTRKETTDRYVDYKVSVDEPVCADACPAVASGQWVTGPYISRDHAFVSAQSDMIGIQYRLTYVSGSRGGYARW